MKTLIQNARVLCPDQQMDAVQDMAMADGQIIGYAEAGVGIAELTPDQVVDGTGKYLFPGLIDCAVQLGEPGGIYAGSIASETRAAALSGVTSVVCQPNTAPVIDEPSVVQLIRRRAEAANQARVYCLAALTRGNAGEQLSEMGALKREGVVGVTNANHPIADSLVLRRAMRYAESFGLPLVLNPIEAWLTPDAGVHEGELSTRMGLSGISVAAETAALLRDIAVADDLGIALHVGRLSAGKSLDWVQAAKAQQSAVTCDVAIHQLLLSELETEGFNALANVQPPLRAHEDRERLLRGLKQGEIDIVTSDHRPLSRDKKDGPFAETIPGISGVETLLPLVWHLIVQYELSPLDALATVTANPARRFGIPGGSLAVGKPADVVLYDPMALEDITVSQFNSAGKNSPFDNWLSSGAVEQVWVGGQPKISTDTTAGLPESCQI